ncbi:hypothetical protein BV25DRAFT_1914982 [Artomyces pyxidatus]|uniref:Uncharacterized protein n=1 Tax=Artomyces pyxidatus TaxID=48021 RepID=A0ACB8T5X8_9AGAM|nr:hypothetical protein BV25DRAFT_1914982 [Artomyces pyxidatus]
MEVHVLRSPDDAVLEILENLEYKSLLACQTTCRRLRALVAASVSLQYKIELAACGMVDGPRGSQTLDVTERLRRLRLYDTAWRQLAWTGRSALPYLVGRYPPPTSGGPSLFFTYGHDVDIEVEAILHISSELRGVKERHISFPVHTSHNMLLDPSQDLLAIAPTSTFPVLPHRCQLLSLSTGEAHFLASILDPCANIGERTLIEIRGDLILEGIRPDPESSDWDYYVWNWRTGDMVSTMPSLTHNGSMCNHARFLDNNHILVLGTAEWYEGRPSCIRVIPIAASPLRNVPILADGAYPPGHIFILPMFMQESTGTQTVYHADSSPHSASNSGCFHSDPDERLLSIRVYTRWYSHASEGLDSLTIDMPLETFRSYIATHPLTGDSVTVPWDEWRQGTRVTRHDKTLWACYIDYVLTSGMRRINIRKLAPKELPIVEMLDYHPRRVARAIARRRNGGGESETVLFRSDEFDGEVYDDLQTALPCVLKQIPLPDELAQGWDDQRMVECCLCEDGVIFMEISPTIDDCITSAWEYRF